MATEQQVQQTLADLPTWLLILVALAGLTGEMWRADAAGMAVGELVKRVAMRFGASAVFGLATMLLATAWGSSLLTAGALGSVVACLGADVASGLYSRWLARKAGVCDVPAPGRGTQD